MKKKIAAILMIAALVMSAVIAVAACAPINDENVLNIVCLNKGYGRDWIDELVKKFEADNPGYTVNLEATSSARQVIGRNISSKNNVDDLYISVGTDWMKFARDGQLANLDDLMNEQVDGVALKDKVNVEYQNSIYYPDKNGDLHTYRLPWIAATGGIFYNKKMFAENGWEIPETYEQLAALCQQIVDDNIPVSGGASGSIGNRTNVKPFVYTSENPDYFDYTVYTWWAQLAGKDAIKEFTNYSSASNYSTSNPTYAKLKEATQKWIDLFGNSKYVTSGNTNNDAQLKFARGEAAMMFNGDWVYNEIQNYDLTSANFELGVMKTPKVGTASDMLYTVGEDQYIAIPASSIKIDLAKKFIKLMVSDYGCKTFMQKANGLLAYKCEFAESDFANNAFMKDLVETRNSYEGTFTEYPTMDINSQENVAKTTKMLYLAGSINFWGTSAYRPYANMLTYYLSGKGQTSIDEAFKIINSGVSAKWDEWKRDQGLN